MLLIFHLYLGPLCFLLAACEEPQSEGLTSTSLLDLSSLVDLPSSPHETSNSDEPGNYNGNGGYQEADILQSLINTPQGSGFSNLDSEEISILQSPQYFWDEKGMKYNDSSDISSEINTDDPVPWSGPEEVNEETSNSSSPSKENQEAFTNLWSTASGETHRPIFKDILKSGEQATVQPTSHHWESGLQDYGDKTEVNSKPAANHTHQVSKLHRKNKKHSLARNHIKNDPKSDLPGGPPANSHGHRQKEDKDLFPHDKQNEDVIEGGSHGEKTKTSDIPLGSQQVVCKDWINLAGKNYVILNMSNTIDCEQFRWEKGQQLASLLQGALFFKSEVSQRDWVILLSKPNENDNHLLMAITEEQRLVPIKDIFIALGDIKRGLAEIGIEGYSSTVSCQSRPNQPRSDYGKLFVVLVIIGSICVMIIVAGIIYICWQRRLPKLKNMELHFVENGCHDNPTLDVAMDSQSEMQEKKSSINGGNSHRADGWETLIDKSTKEEVDGLEEDTHL